jgi:hypothetical protein
LRLFKHQIDEPGTVPIEEVKKLTIPPIVPTSEAIIENPFEKVMRYLYNMQNFEVLRPELNEINVVNLYALAYSLEMAKLLSDLD